MTDETDVVVVGTGAAGAAAAIAALEAGAEVRLLESAETPAVPLAAPAGPSGSPTIHICAAGAEDPREDALRLMARLAWPALYDPNAEHLGIGERAHALLTTYYDEGAAVIDRLARLGAIHAMILPGLGASPSPISDPDYHAELPENRSPYGRVLTAVPAPGAMVWPGVFLADGLLAHLEGRGARVLRGPRCVTRMHIASCRTATAWCSSISAVAGSSTRRRCITCARRATSTAASTALR